MVIVGDGAALSVHALKLIAPARTPAERKNRRLPNNLGDPVIFPA